MATILHKIRAYLYDNALTKDDVNDYIALVSSEHSLSVKQIAEIAALRGGSDISAPAMEHAVNVWMKEMAYQLCDGFSVNTGWFTAAVHIKGVFNSPQEQFNPEKQHILFEFHQGAELRRELSAVTVEILGLADSGIFIAQVEDKKSGSVNDLLTPGRNLKITGQKIRVIGNENEEGVGVFFRSQSNPAAVYPVAMDDIVINNPSEVMIVIPDLAVDTYRLEITTQFSVGQRLLNEPRTAVFDRILEVK
ncbi:MAG: DUF4469 domain-containing protein [Dysgonamonadaceae bacterium]|jgi:hypothetical protein|nr:DUF4469 domain-containing protein [Dysgonamonadaceae bacterium]